MTTRIHTAVTDDALDVAAAWSFAADPTCGAVVVFTGVVRDHADGRAVAGLTYEAWRERAVAGLDEVAADTGRRYPAARAVWLEHRVGALAVGDPSVVVAVSAPHREAAFAAARHAIDTLKATVPIWKREHWRDGGAHWPGTD